MIGFVSKDGIGFAEGTDLKNIKILLSASFFTTIAKFIPSESMSCVEQLDS